MNKVCHLVFNKNIKLPITAVLVVSIFGRIIFFFNICVLILDQLDVIFAKKRLIPALVSSFLATVQQEMNKIKNSRMYRPWSSLH